MKGIGNGRKENRLPSIRITWKVKTHSTLINSFMRTISCNFHLNLAPGSEIALLADQSCHFMAAVIIGPESDHWLSLSLTHWLTHWLLFSKLDWCGPGVWWCLLKTCWGCYGCLCKWWGSRWQQFVADFEAEVWLQRLTFVQTLSTRFGQDFEVEGQARFEAGVYQYFVADVLKRL